jgi:membrane associated rhomboid family serine protease
MFRSSVSRGGQCLSRVSRVRAPTPARSYGSSVSFPVSDGNVIFGLIGLNAAVFGAWHLAESDYRKMSMMNKHFLLSYDNFWRQGRVHTLITSVFSHQSIGHIAGNMLTLYFFGSSAVAMLGARQFLTLYMGGGLFSSLCTVTWPDLIPRSWPASWQRSRYAPALGASGAGML